MIMRIAQDKIALTKINKSKCTLFGLISNLKHLIVNILCLKQYIIDEDVTTILFIYLFFCYK
ncbi:hypothetical protein B4V02_09475 [Paenibacillus kribbensis]|uniref:Uncharacterized protein n=1 Tax=Paenibacillus kribbensis TaxID=172713 RepID=A0A222WLM7_9BACL|nr:hypothetical protein B4V02_09475 [Paenibacillus kribbensis]